MPVIQGHIVEGATVHTDGWRAINGIEFFWSFAKRLLAKINGIASHKFILHLKECEFRLSYRNHDFYATMVAVFTSI